MDFFRYKNGELYCEDVPETLARIEAAGGATVLEKMPVPGMGWIGLFTDPSGNTVGLFTANDPPPGDVMDMAGGG